MKYDNLSGQKFDKWTVLNDPPISDSHGTHVICLCECGTKRKVRAIGLLRGKTKCCGCNRGEKWKGTPPSSTLPSGYAARNQLLAQYKRGAKNGNHIWTIPKEEFYRLTSSNCNYCGIPPQQVLKARKMNGNYLYNGLDRIDNVKGYIIENVVPCCWICNRAKRELTNVQFWNWIGNLVTTYTQIVETNERFDPDSEQW